MPAPAHLDKRQGGNPLLELVDCYAWMPLRIKAKRSELLEALTASGGFDNEEVCTLPPPFASTAFSSSAVATSTVSPSLPPPSPPQVCAACTQP